MDEIDLSFMKPKIFVGLGFSYFGFLTYGGLRSPKGTALIVYAFHRYHWLAVNIFCRRCATVIMLPPLGGGRGHKR